MCSIIDRDEMMPLYNAYVNSHWVKNTPNFERKEEVSNQECSRLTKCAGNAKGRLFTCVFFSFFLVFN